MPPNTDVLPKLMLAALVPTRMPCAVDPETVVLPKATVPPIVARLMPCVPLDVVVTLEKAEVAAKVPFVRLSAWPAPLSTRSGNVLLPAVRVPKALPKIFCPRCVAHCETA